MHGALAPRALAPARRRGAASGASLLAARLPARLRAAGAKRACRARSARVAATAEGEDAAAPGEEASSSGRDASRAASAPAAAGAVTGLRARLRAVRESPMAAAVVGGGRAVGGWLKSLPGKGRKARLQELAQAANASADNSAAEDAYLEALLEHSPEDLIARVDEGTRAMGARGVSAYLQAMLETGGLARVAKGEPGAPSMPQLLGTLRDRAGGEKRPAAPGELMTRPLHVTVVDTVGSSERVPWLLGFALQVGHSIMVLGAVSLLWFAGTSLMRRSHSSSFGGSPMGLSIAPVADSRAEAPGGSATSFAPKEYVKSELPEKSVKKFSDVLGCDEAKQELREVVEYLKNPERFTALGGKLPKGVLLEGPPGNGKTLLAKAVAGEAGVPFFFRAGSEFDEMFVGVGSRRVRALFAAAKKKAPCIVFIDEIDAIGGSRKYYDSSGGGGRKTLNQLLVEMDGFESNDGVIVIAATNQPESLDGALTRPGRFDRHVHIPVPDVKGRRAILAHYLADKPVTPDVDVDVLARGTSGMSGAELSNLVNTAAIQAAVSGEERISARLLDWARDRVLMGQERKSFFVSEPNRRVTAYHEAGHALVALRTPGAMAVHKATILPRGNTLGMVQMLPEEDTSSTTLRELRARIDVSMGGRVAEELVFGADAVTTGASNDLKQATAVARRMVTQYGMSELVGPISLGGDSASADTKRVVDSEVSRMLRESEQRVRAMLKGSRPELDAVAKALLDNELLTADQIRDVLAKLKAGDGGGGADVGMAALAPAHTPADALPEVATAGALPRSSAN